MVEFFIFIRTFVINTISYIFRVLLALILLFTLIYPIIDTAFEALDIPNISLLAFFEIWFFKLQDFYKNNFSMTEIFEKMFNNKDFLGYVLVVSMFVSFFNTLKIGRVDSNKN